MKKDGSKVEARHRNLVEPGTKGKLGEADDFDANLKAVKENWRKMSPVSKYFHIMFYSYL